MKEKKIDFDFFGDGMRIFLQYIDRQNKKKANYSPHPIIRAFECALQGIKNIKEGQHTLGFSSDGSGNRIFNPYAVVLEKIDNGVEVKEIRDLRVNKELPLDVMITIFRLQIYLDKVQGDTVNPDQMVNALNAVIPGNKFYTLGHKWKDACDKFKILLEEGKFHFPSDSDLAEKYSSIKNNTPWEEYPNQIRCLIGTSVASQFGIESGTILITSPPNSEIEKAKVFESAIEFLIGKMSDYFDLRKTEKNS